MCTFDNVQNDTGLEMSPTIHKLNFSHSLLLASFTTRNFFFTHIFEYFKKEKEKIEIEDWSWNLRLETKACLMEKKKMRRSLFMSKMIVIKFCLKFFSLTNSRSFIHRYIILLSKTTTKLILSSKIATQTNYLLFSFVFFFI